MEAWRPSPMELVGVRLPAISGGIHVLRMLRCTDVAADYLRPVAMVPMAQRKLFHRLSRASQARMSSIPRNSTGRSKQQGLLSDSGWSRTPRQATFWHLLVGLPTRCICASRLGVRVHASPLARRIGDRWLSAGQGLPGRAGAATRHTRHIPHPSRGMRCPSPCASMATARALRLTPSCRARSARPRCNDFGVRNTHLPL